MSRNLVLRAALGVLAVIVVGAGGFVAWRTFFGHSPKPAGAKAPVVAKAAATPSPAPIVLPPNAPTVTPGLGLDPVVVDRFAKRLAEVNSLAHTMIVTAAEYHDNDGGQRYFTAVVTSCKALNKIWPITRGVLNAKVVGPLRLKADFAEFAFVEHYSEGQWGLSDCENI